jgi:FkbM family methyltransferase
MNFQGQNKEDEFVYQYFKNKFGEEFKGSVLDIGANDGVTLSNSFFLITQGWKGYLVEAGKNPFYKLASLYQNTSKEIVKCYNLALGDKNEIVTFYESKNLINTSDIGLVSSAVSEETIRWRNAGVEYEEYSVLMQTFDTFANQNELSDKIFDFISIDIEGLDWEVLKQIDLGKFGCKCLCVEFNGKEKEKYVEYALKYDLYLAVQNAENLIFVK